MFVQVCDIFPLIRTNCFSADAVANCFLLTEDLVECAVWVLLPVDFITIYLIRKYPH